MKRIQFKGPMVSDMEKEVYDYFGLDSVSAKSVQAQLPDDGSDVIFEVSSGGGLVTAGAEIYDTFKRYRGKVTAEVTGIAASAASVAIMGADNIVMSPVAQIMIHRALFSRVSGNAEELEKATNVLKASDEAIINAYEIKTGLEREKLMTMMSEETFLTAQEAIELGFADEVMDYETINSNNNGLLPKEVINDYFINKREREKQEIIKGL